MRTIKIKMAALFLLAAMMFTTLPVNADMVVTKYSPGVSDARVANITAYYMRVPEKIRQRYEMSGGRVMAVQNLAGIVGSGTSLRGYASYTGNYIMIDNRAVAESTIVHEMGHMADYMSGFAFSNDPAFAAIWNAEVGQFASLAIDSHPANYNTPIEYFAEAFHTYILNPTGLASKCPQTYAYIVNAINTFQ